MYIRLLALIVAVLSFGAAAEDAPVTGKIADEIRALGDDDFDVREAATAALSDLGEPYAAALARLSADSKDPEVAERLRKAARAVFMRHVLTGLDGWKYEHVDVGFDFTYIYMGQDRRPPMEIEVVSVDPRGGAPGMRADDIITSITADGTDFITPKHAREDGFPGFFVQEMLSVGKEYAATVLRNGEEMTVAIRPSARVPVSPADLRDAETVWLSWFEEVKKDRAPSR